MSIIEVRPAVPEQEVQLRELLRRVEAGEQFTVTAAGRPIAEMHPPGPRQYAVTWDEFWTAMERIPRDPSFAADIRALTRDEPDDESRWR